MILVGLADAGLIDARRDPDTGRVFSVRVKGTTIRDITGHPETMELIGKLQRGEFPAPPESPGPTTRTTDATGGAQEGAERPWWRRVFGG